MPNTKGCFIGWHIHVIKPDLISPSVVISHARNWLLVFTGWTVKWVTSCWQWSMIRAHREHILLIRMTVHQWEQLEVIHASKGVTYINAPYNYPSPLLTYPPWNPSHNQGHPGDIINCQMFGIIRSGESSPDLTRSCNRGDLEAVDLLGAGSLDIPSYHNVCPFLKVFLDQNAKSRL